MIGGSSSSYLAPTPCVPLFCTLFSKGGNRRVFRLPGQGPLGLGVKKARKKGERELKTSRKHEKYLRNCHFRLFFVLFLAPGPRDPGNPFSDFFRSFPGRGFLTPVDGQRYPNPSLGTSGFGRCGLEKKSGDTQDIQDSAPSKTWRILRKSGAY